MGTDHAHHMAGHHCRRISAGLSKRICVLVLISAMTNALLSSEPNALSVAFDSTQKQNVTSSVVTSLFGNCIFIDPEDGSATQGRNTISNGVLRVQFPAGLWDAPTASATEGSGLIFQVRLQSRPVYEYATRVYFEPGFDFGRTADMREGKLTGLGGGSNPSGGSTPDGTGFTSRFIWQNDDAGSTHLKLYVYYLSQQNRTAGQSWGDTIDLGLNLVPGHWYTLRMRIAIDPTTGYGQATTWADGVKTPNQPTLCNSKKWVNAGIGVDTFLFETFFGGGEAGYAPAKDCALQFDDVQLAESFSAPVIATQPANTSVTAGKPAAFAVAATGTPAPTHQWQRDGVDIPGATSASYAIPATNIGDNGASFRCIITNAAGSTTSNPAKLTVAQAKPTFVGDWEAGITGAGLWHNTQVVTADRLRRVTDVVRQGTYAARVEVRPGDDPIGASGERAEVVNMTDASGQTIYENESSGTQFFAFSLRLDPNWQAPVPDANGHNWAIVFQLHGPDSLGTSPSIAISVLDRLSVQILGGDLDVPGKNQPMTTYPLSTSALNPGHWIDLVIGVRFAKDFTGEVDVWRHDEDGTAFSQVLAVKNIPTLQYRSSQSGVGNHYWKHGFYRAKQTSIANVLWLDGLVRAPTYDAAVQAAFPDIPNAAPTIDVATATPTTVTAKTTSLSVTASDDGGAAALTYTWTATGPAAVTFSPNGTNAAKDSTATFSKAGNYALTVTAKDAGGLTGSRTVAVTVNAAATNVAVTPASASVVVGSSVDFTDSVTDQFGAALTTQPATIWTVSGGGAINSSGRYIAGPSAGGSFTVTATSGALHGTAQVTVTAGALDPLISGVARYNDGAGPWGGNAVNTADKAYDGDTGSFYDCAAANTGFTGIDVGAGQAARVTAIRYWARAGWPSRMTGGVLEASNSQTSGYIILATVATASDTAWMTLPITGTSSYRYLRYRGPANGNCNVAEVEFHGTMTAVWNSTDIGGPLPSGSTSLSGGVVTISGSGADIWGTSDAFRFAAQPLSGDGQITARVVSQTTTDPWTKAGVMIRENLTPGSRQAMTVVTPGNGVAFQRRLDTNASSSHTAGAKAAVPYWVRLSRAGNVFTAYQSADGVTWKPVGNAIVAMGSNAYIGLAVTSHRSGVLSTAVFDAITIIATPAGGG